MDEIIKKIENSQKIAIFCHENADWDAIWCLLWLWTLLENMGKNITFVSPDKPSRIFGFLPWFRKIQSEFDYGKYDLLIMVDCSEYKRLWKISEWKEDYFNQNDIVVFDHHELKQNPSHRLIMDDPSATSCCEVILENTKWPRNQYFTNEIATYLYLWLTTDSGNFRFDENPERIYTNALTLIKLWANKKLIMNNLVNSKSVETIMFLRHILQRLTIDWDIAYTYYDIVELDEYGIDNEQAWYWLTIIQELQWPKVIMTIRKVWDTVKCSLRSKITDVHKIAESYWGGWHIHASWFSAKIQWDFENTIKTIITKIKTMI